MKRILLIIVSLLAASGIALAASISNQELEQVINNWVDSIRNQPQSTWIKPVKVTSIDIRGKQIKIHTNPVLEGISLSPNQLHELQLILSHSLLGDTTGNIKIYSNKHELSSLITDRWIARSQYYPHDTTKSPLVELAPTYFTGCNQLGDGSLKGRTIAISPSHGTYYNQEEDLWKWQRATMWTTVEDLYTTEYTRLLGQMLDNAGAIVLQPRPRIEGKNLRQVNGRWQFEADSAAWLQGSSGMFRWEEGAQEWLRFAGYPEQVWSPSKGESNYRDDCLSRGYWVNYLIGGCSLNPNQKGLGIALDACIAIHTDGVSEPDNHTTVGTLAIYSTEDDAHNTSFPNGVSRFVNRDLADYIQTAIVDDIRRTVCPDWMRRSLQDKRYAEARIPQVPTVLLEILSHKNMADMKYGLQPAFRWNVARSIYKGILCYMCQTAGTEPVVQPLPVKDCKISRAGIDSILIEWKDQLDSLESSAQATYHLIEWCTAQNQWNDTIIGAETSLKLKLTFDTPYQIQVRAGNAGGQSMPSVRLGAMISATPQAPCILLIDGFNRTDGPEWFEDTHFAGICPNSYAIEDNYSVAYIGQQINWDKKTDWIDDDNCGFGMCARYQQANLSIGNTHDYTCKHGEILAQKGISYMSAEMNTIDHIDSMYTAVEYILGKQVLNDTIKQQHQTIIHNYLQQGGKVLISGSYLGSGTHHKRRAPLNLYTGEVQLDIDTSSIYHLYTQPNAKQLFAEQVESIDPLDSAQRIGLYRDMRISCGIRWSQETSQLVVLGFPIDAVKEWKNLYEKLIGSLIE